MRVAVLCCTALLAAAESFAQTDRNGTLVVTVVDETRAVLPGANVTLAGTEAATKTAAALTAATNPQGQATFPNLTPGRYSVAAEFPGFQTRTLPDIRVRTGENKQAVMLPIDRLQSDVTVARDRQAAASDRDVTFGSVMTREQIEALSDDPDELRRQLIDIAGPDAKILVDSFEGRDLPPKALIKSIRITRDQFAPEVHFAGELRIEILTQPGVGPVRGNVRMGFYDSATDGKNPIVGVRGPAQSMNVRGRAERDADQSACLVQHQFQRHRQLLTPVQLAATPNGQVRQNAAIRSPQDNVLLLRRPRLRADARPGAAPQLQWLALQQGEHRRTATSIRSNAPIPQRTATSASSSSRTVRSAAVSSSTPGSPSSATTRRRPLPSRRRQSSSTTRSRLAAPSERAARTHAITGSTPTSITCAAFTRCAPAWRSRTAQSETDSDSNYLGTYVFEDLDAMRHAGRAASRGARGIRTSTTRTCRAVSTSRTTSKSGRG